MSEPEKFRYYVTWVDQGPAGTVYGSFFTNRSRPIESDIGVFDLKRIAGAKGANDKHIVILDWKLIK